MTKKEMVSAILEIEEVDTKANLMKKSNKELEDILTDLESTEKIVEPVVQESIQPQVDMKALMEQMKAEMLEELKEQARKEVEAERESNPDPVKEAEDKKTPIRKKEIDRFEPIPVMNVTNGKLIYVSKKTGAEWVWGDYGDIEYVEFQELLTMRSGQKRFLDEPFLLILEEDVVDYLGLNKMYDSMINLDSLDDIFKLNQKDFEEIVEKSPKGIKHSIVTRARQKVENETLDSVKKIKYINERFNTDIGQRG